MSFDGLEAPNYLFGIQKGECIRLQEKNILANQSFRVCCEKVWLVASQFLALLMLNQGQVLPDTNVLVSKSQLVQL